MFSKVLPFTKQSHSEKLVSYFFSTLDNSYTVSIVISVNGFLRVSFDLDTKGQGIYSTGNSLSVFSTVIAIIKQELSLTGVSQVSFASKINATSRVSLYDKLCQYFSKRYNAVWEFEDDCKSREYTISFS